MVWGLRRPSNFAGGITVGGADTNTAIQPQKHTITQRVKGSAVTLWIPKGAILISTVVLPDDTAPATTGDVQIDRVTGGANAELAASAAETPKITLYSPAKQLAVDTEYTITPTNTPDGYTYVGFEVYLPRIRK